MLKVGLTGNIGSGKSLVAGIFTRLGVPVYLADEESKRFLSDPAVAGSVGKLFGSSVVIPSGEIDRKALGSLVFSDPGKLSILTDILHPLVINDFREWCRLYPEHPYILLETAILFETGFDKEFDRIISVSCPEEKAIERVVRRDGVTREAVLPRARIQMKDKEKATASDFVILNDGSELVIPQVMEIHRLLSECRP